MNAKCRTTRVWSSSHILRSMLHSFTLAQSQIGDPISKGGFEHSTNFRHSVRHSALLKCHVVKSSVTRPLRQRSSGWNSQRKRCAHPLISFRCRLSSHCCCCYYCWCCLLLRALLDVPCAYQSYLSSVPHTAFQVAVERLQASPNNGCDFLPGKCFGHWTPKLLTLVALEAAPLRPQGDVSCAEIPTHSVLQQIGQSAL